MAMSLSCNYNGTLLLIDMVGIGAAYGTARAGSAIASVGVANPGIVMRALVPVIMAGILSIFGLVIAIFITTGSTPLTHPD